MMNTNINKGWERITPFKEIPNLSISKEILDWFLNQGIKDIYKKILFGLYIQAKIQEANPNSTAPIDVQNWNRNNNWRKFKQYADIEDGLSAEKAIKALKEYGYIETNIFSTSFKLLFIQEKAFQYPPQVHDRKMTYYEMEHPSEFLQQYLNGIFICEHCGRVSGYKSKSKKSQVKQKYCGECAVIMHIELTRTAESKRKGKENS